MALLRTPRSLWIVASLAAFLYVFAPVENIVFLRTQLDRGVFPVNADSIGIPIYWFTLMLIVLSPVYVLFAYAALRRYVGGVPLWAFDTSQWLRSTVWTLVYGGLVATAVYQVGYYIQLRMPLSVAVSVLWAYLLLCIRASLASRPPVAT